MERLLTILRQDTSAYNLSCNYNFSRESNGRTVIFEIYRYNVRVLLVRLALRNARSAALEALIWAVEKEQGGGLVRQRNDGVHLLLKRYDD